MLLFTDGDLDWMAAFFGPLGLKDTCDILRFARTPDGNQGFRETWPVHSTEQCLVVSSGSPRLEEIAQQTLARDENLFCLAPGTDVLRPDRLSYNGYTYEIIDLLDPTTYTVWLRVVAKKQETGS
jgi:hypothetical protein